MEFGWSVPMRKMPDDYFQPHNIWHIGFGKLGELLLVELSNQILVSNDHSIGIYYEDKGGPLSLDPDDEHILLIGDVLQAIIPDDSLIGCQVLDYEARRAPERIHQLGTDKSRLREVFKYLGSYPAASVTEHLFVGGTPAMHESKALRKTIKQIDKFHHKYYRRSENPADTPQDIINLLHEFELTIWAFDDWVFIITWLYDKEEMKKILQEVAASYGLRIPLHDYVLVI